jgi:PKD repeat protein
LIPLCFCSFLHSLTKENNFMKNIKLLLSTIIISALSLNAYSQVDSKEAGYDCGTSMINNQRLAENPWIQNIIDDQNRLAKEYEKNHVANKAGNVTYIIPTVYHIIHDNGPENLSKATIEGSIQSLNDDFQKLNSDISNVVAAFTGIAADIEVEFRLAHIDPNGDCTEGITRTVSQLTYAGDESLKSLVSWDTYKYYNIWVCKTIASGAGGYAYYPGWAPSQSQEGVVIRSDGTGRTLTHETGHFFNLAHTWGSSNTPAVATNCNSDDGVSDTPNCIGTSGCNTANVSCSSLDNVQNHMEYAPCRVMFTEGQKSRMTSAINSSNGGRNSLWTVSNLNATGTNNPYGPVTCAPIADFDYDKDMICEGASITYTDNSYNGVPTAWNWTFNGGSPGTSPLPSPTITYNTAGTYSTTHQPSTSGGSGSITKNNIITVSSLTADYAGVLVDGFENNTQFNNDWIVNNPSGGQAFMRTTSAAATGSASVWIRNFFTSNSGEEDILISPSYDLSTISNPTFKFKVAFARKTTTDADRLLVWWSINCGETWALKLPMVGVSLETTGGVVTSFYSPAANDWVEKTINLSTISTETNVRFKFAFESGGGNNLYLDDINIDGTVSIEDPLSNIGSFNVYPNPSTDGAATISFNLTENVNKLEVSLIDVLGKEVTKVINGKSFAPGKYSLDVDKTHRLESGIYFIRFSADDNVKVKKLIVQ